MKKRISIISTFIISMSIAMIFFVLVVLGLRFNQYFATGENKDSNSSIFSLSDFFSNIGNIELFAIFGVAFLMSALVIRYLALNIKKNINKFSQHFHNAAYSGEMIDEESLSFKEFTALAQSVNHMTRKANEDKKRLESNEKYLQAILDAQKSMVIVQSNGKIESANLAFINFMHVKSLQDFKNTKKCISDFFVDEEEFLSKDIDWVTYIIKHKLMSHKVKIVKNSKETIFSVSANLVKFENENSKVVITFNNISQLEQQKKEIEKAAQIDPLTGVANRMKFNITLEHQVDMAKRYNHSFCIILFDIDNFKLVNDTYGHQVGDNILVELALRIKNAMRKSDTFARWGGEEFAIILPQSRVKTAVKIADKLRLIIADKPFDDGLSITCSFGVCEYKKSYELEDLIECVDKMLYLAKSKGKNQVQFKANS